MNSRSSNGNGNGNTIMSGVPLEDVALTADELAHACSVQTAWVVEHVQAGLLAGVSVTSVVSSTATTMTTTTTPTPAELRFTSPELVRARRLLAIERDFEANPELAALAVDLIEEVERLKRQLHAAIGGE